MNPADDSRDELALGIPAASEEIDDLKAQIAELQMQVYILKETLIVLKKAQAPTVPFSGIRRRQRWSTP